MKNLQKREIDMEKCKELLLKVVEQAKRDIINFYDTNDEIEKEIFGTARDFFFDREYRIDWGDAVFSLIDIANILELHVDWIRKKIMEEIVLKMREKEESNGQKKRRNRY